MLEPADETTRAAGAEPETDEDAEEPEEDEDDPVAEQAVEELEEELEEEEEQKAAPVKEVQPPKVRRLDIVGRRNWFFLFSLLIIIPGIFSMSTRHFLLGIDFAGGTEYTISFNNHPVIADVQNAVDQENVDGSVISAGAGGYIIRTPPMDPGRQKTFEDDLQGKLGPMVIQQVLEVGGTIAKETIEFALLAVVLASLAILLLLAIRFRNVPGGWRAGFQFGGSALAALLHDVFRSWARCSIGESGRSIASS